MQSIAVRIRTACTRCGAPLPLNAMVPRLACPACGGENLLDDEFWVDILGDRDLGSSTILTAGREVALEVSVRETPACAACGTAIPMDAVLAAADAGSLPCPGCGVRTLLRVPPRPWVLSGFPLLVGEDELQVPSAEGAAVAAPRAALSPVAFNCPTCGGVLQVDGRSRVVRCQYCSGSAYLPDGLWHVFHPVPVARPWTLLYDRRARKRGRMEAEDPATPAGRLHELAGHVDHDVRQAVARHPHTPPATLRRLVQSDDSLAADVLENPSLPPAMWPELARMDAPWVLSKIADSPNAPPDALCIVAQQVAHRLSDGWAGDEDAFDSSSAGDVLQSLAQNPATPSRVLADVARLNRERVPSERADVDEALAKHAATPAALLADLARSDDEDVRQAVAAHPATPVEVLESLAADPEWSVREAAAKRTQLSSQTLKRLGSDDDSSVREAARANASYPRFSLRRMLFGG